MKTIHRIVAAAASAAALFGCATMPGSAESDKLAQDMIRSGFRTEGIAKAERVTALDETLVACNAADVAGKPLDAATAKRLEEANLKAVKWPAGGKFLGDWKKGEAVAQSGRGLTWTDGANTVNGGNCYNCHQISKEETSFGTIGPSLYNYGKIRGVTDPASAAARPVVEYTWGKIWNAKAYNACSNMPRFGHMGIIGEQDIRDVMALLLDPNSPVNK